jgi:hypothetical protein
MEKLKALFGSEALTFEQLEAKLKDNEEVKLANLATGDFVSKKKYEDKVTELSTANGTIKELRETVSKFDGVDVEGLKQQAKDLETKYNTDLAAVKLNSAVDLALMQAKAKDAKLAKSALDMSIIKLDGENLIGLSEQLGALKESHAYLFETEDPNSNPARVNTGANHNQNTNTDSFMSAFMKGAGIEEKKGD